MSKDAGCKPVACDIYNRFSANSAEAIMGKAKPSESEVLGAIAERLAVPAGALHVVRGGVFVKEGDDAHHICQVDGVFWQECAGMLATSGVSACS